MHEATRNFLIGLTAIVALLGLGGLLLAFGELDTFLHQRYDLKINIDNGQGLRPKSRVEMNGIPVGVVATVGLHPTEEWPVQLLTRIDEGVQIPAGSTAFVSRDLLGGAATLQLRPPDDRGAGGFLPSDGTAVIAGRAGSLVGEVTAQLEERMAPLLEGLDSFTELVDTYNELGAALTEFVRPQSDEAVATGAPPNLAAIVEQLHGVLTEVDAALALAKEWLGDEQIQTDTRAAISNAGELIERATSTLQRYALLADELQEDANSVTQQLLPVADELAATLEEVRRLTRAANEGEGTVARMLNDPELYNSLTDAAVRLERALADVQLFVQKLKAEGVPIRF